MGGSIRLARLWGIEIRIHFSWLFIFAVVAMGIYDLFQSEGHGTAVSLLMGVAAGAALFVCILAHELAHSLVAMRNGIPVRSITLFVLGGVANISKEAERPGAEMQMAVAGPATSLVIGVACGAAWFAVGDRGEDASAYHDLLFWMASLNLGLGVFNLLPGFPMDGGRVLRAVIWRITGNYRKATRIASIMGQAMGWIMAGVGVGIVAAYFFVGGGPSDWTRGLTYIVLGWYLASIASSAYQQVEMREVLRGVSAVSAMVTDFMTVPAGISLAQVVRDYVRAGRYRAFVVATEGRFEGVLDLEGIRMVPEDRWETTTAGAAMTPAGRVVTVAPEDDGLKVAEKMDEFRLDGVPVVREGTVVGIVTRASLGRAMQARARFAD